MNNVNPVVVKVKGGMVAGVYAGDPEALEVVVVDIDGQAPDSWYQQVQSIEALQPFSADQLPQDSAARKAWRALQEVT